MRRNILVADDDQQILELTKFFLEQAGFVVRTCSEGYSALQEVQANHYDLLIIDISMPNFNGFKTIKSIRAMPEKQDLPIIMLTGSKDKDDIQKAKTLQVTDYVIKPPVREDLLKRVERVLGGRPQYFEIKFNPEDSDASLTGEISIETRVKSISVQGMILTGSAALKKGDKIKVQKIGLFNILKIEKTSFTVADCTSDDKGNFDYFVSFLEFKAEEQEVIKEWVMAEQFRRQNPGAKA